MSEEVSKTLSQLITEITYRAVMTVGPRHGLTKPEHILVIGDALAQKITELVVLQHDKRLIWTFKAKDTATFLMFCDLLDEIEKEIPIVSRMDVYATEVHRVRGLEHA